MSAEDQRDSHYFALPPKTTKPLFEPAPQADVFGRKVATGGEVEEVLAVAQSRFGELEFTAEQLSTRSFLAQLPTRVVFVDDDGVTKPYVEDDKSVEETRKKPPITTRRGREDLSIATVRKIEHHSERRQRIEHRFHENTRLKQGQGQRGGLRPRGGRP